MTVTQYQEKVYTLLKQIPSGKVSTYAAMSKALNSSPRAIGGACRNNPFAPEVPCHRVISATGYIGGFKGDWRDAPSGINCEMKLELLKEEGVLFDENGKLVDKENLWSDFKGICKGSSRSFLESSYGSWIMDLSGRANPVANSRVVVPGHH